MSKQFASHADLTDKVVSFEKLSDNAYAYTAEGDPNTGVIIGDEAHQFKAKSLTSIMEKAGKIKYRFGFTGTLDGSLTNEITLKGLFGSVHRVTTTKEQIGRAHV